MKKKIDHITNPITLAIVIAGLAVALPLSTVSARFSTSAQAANRYSDESTLLQDSLQEAVADTRYEARWEERPAKGMLPSAYHAPNPAQQYDAYFTPNGLSLTPQVTAPNDAMPKWRVGMRLIGFGYGEDLLNVGTAAIETHGARIEYRRTWLPITEWYVNKAAGLEQGFTIDTAPGTKSEREPLRLALELTGDVSAELANGGQSIVFKLADEKPAVTYSGLYAYDAQGRELPSEMNLSKGQVILEVDDENAIYPVTIDPTFSVQTKIVHPFAASDPEFSGSSVAIYGNTVVVGAPSKNDGANVNQGVAYVLTYSNNVWGHQATLRPSDGATDDHFGVSVAISGNTIVVGARHADVNSNSDQGAAYVFVRNGGIWTEQQKVTDFFGGMAQDRFGTSVAISVDTLVVGADPFPRQGAAYVFVRSSGVWSPQQKLTNSTGTTYDIFGVRVAISLNTVVVGAAQDTIGFNSPQGSAYVFVRNGTVWNQQARLIAGDGAAGDQFGFSVAISGDSVVVGAPFDSVGTNSLQGSAYVFTRTLSSWNQQAKLTASDGKVGDYFGWSVAIHGYTIVVGAPHDDVQSSQQGSAYVFVQTGQIWSQQQQLTAFDGWASDKFGTSVATSAGAIVVGAPLDDFPYGACRPWCNSSADQGSAYVFRQ